MFDDEVNFTARNFTLVCALRELLEDFFSDGEVSSLLSCKVFFDELAVGTPKVVDGIGKVLTDVDFAVGIGDLVNNLHSLFAHPNNSLGLCSPHSLSYF